MYIQHGKLNFEILNIYVFPIPQRSGYVDKPGMVALASLKTSVEVRPKLVIFY